MATINMTLQGKGGVGKSFITSTLAQYKYDQTKGTPLCIDTDPVNSTFFGFKDLNVRQIKLLEGDEINPRKFDTLVELIAESENDVVIDNGASTFVPLSHYLISNHVPALLNEMGHTIVIHTVITGSQALLDTVNGFKQMAVQFPNEVKFVVWLNPYWGEIRMNGKSFEEMRTYQDHQDRISAIVNIPKYKEDTFGHDIADMLKARLTFDQAIKSNDYSIMARQRLKIVKKQLFELIQLTDMTLQ